MLGSGGTAQQVGGFNTQRSRKLHQHLDRWVARPAFNIADIGPVDVSLKGIFFLAPALRCAQPL